MATKKRETHRACGWGDCPKPRAYWVVNREGQKPVGYCADHIVGASQTLPSGYKIVDADGQPRGQVATAAPSAGVSAPPAPPARAEEPPPPPPSAPPGAPLSSLLEPIPELPAAPVPVEPRAGLDWRTAGSQAVSERQAQILRAPVDPDTIDIRPDGLIYLPQIFIRQRLLDAFGPGGWALVPLSRMHVQDETAMVHYALVAEGRVIGEAVGEMKNNRRWERQTEATLREGAKSDALTRIAKDLGVGWECWDFRFQQTWKAKYAVQVWVARRNRYEWRRKDAPPLDGEGPQGRESEPEGIRRRDFIDDARDHLSAIAEEEM